MNCLTVSDKGGVFRTHRPDRGFLATVLFIVLFAFYSSYDLSCHIVVVSHISFHFTDLDGRCQLIVHVPVVLIFSLGTSITYRFYYFLTRN